MSMWEEPAATRSMSAPAQSLLCVARDTAFSTRTCADTLELKEPFGSIGCDVVEKVRALVFNHYKIPEGNNM